MNLLPSFRSLTSGVACAACGVLVGCAGTSEPTVPTVVRTPAPRAYESTINNYFAFKLRGSQKNATISVGAPEPDNCSLDGYVNSIRGWVVPVVHETRTAEPPGKPTIRINAKQYYFWFLGNTIAGVTARRELCPGLGTAFDPEPAPFAPRAAAAPASSPSTDADALHPVAAEPAERSAADRAQRRVKPSRAQKADATRRTKKAAKGSATARPAGKAADSGAAGQSEPKQ